MSPWAADFSWAQLSAAQLKAAGYSGAIRYIIGPSVGGVRGKEITPAEFHDLTNTPGMALALVNETGPQAAQGGYPIGVAEARAAFARADTLGWPKDRPIYMVGEDPHSMPLPQPAIEAYFRGVGAVVHVNRIGAYGSAAVINDLFARGLITYGWAVETWPGNQARCHLQQRYNPYPGAPSNRVAGGAVDPNMILKLDWGQWSAVTPNPAQARPAPTEEGPMLTTDQLAANQIDTFQVDGNGRVIHHWFNVGIGWAPAEVLAAGAVPRGDLALNTHWSGDGHAHLFAEAPAGAQLHCWWDGHTWHGDTQGGPT